jgi:hypothetical protein
MRAIIKRYLQGLGFATHQDIESDLDDAFEDIDKLYTQAESFLVDVQNEFNTKDYNQIYREAVEINHRLKKLEEYLGVEYKSEIKHFIGYKKKSKCKKSI